MISSTIVPAYGFEPGTFCLSDNGLNHSTQPWRAWQLFSQRYALIVCIDSHEVWNLRHLKSFYRRAWQNDRRAWQNALKCTVEYIL